MAKLHDHDEEVTHRGAERSVHTETTHSSAPARPDVYVDERRVEEQSTRYAQVNAGTVNSLLGIVLLALESLLAVRFMLVAFAASRGSGFVRFILDLSRPFVRPFEQAFANRAWDQGVIEPGTVLAMVVYAVAFLLVMMLVNALMPQFTERYGVERRAVSRDEPPPVV